MARRQAEPWKPLTYDRGSVLRAIHRLRSGTPPSEHIRELTVGAQRICPPIVQWLSGEEGLRRWFLCAGNPGDGKSHTLSLIRDMAHSLGYATCHINADASSSALNHPQRFLPLLLGTLEVPSSRASGYEELLYDVLSDQARVFAANDIVQRHLGTGRTADVGASWAIHCILQLDSSAYGSNEHASAIRSASFHLSGDSTRYRAGTAGTRSGAYALLQVAVELSRSTGARGLVLLIDEVESVFTKLPTVKSRLGAYKVLAALCAGVGFPDVRVALALTPDAEEWLRAELSMESAAMETVLEPVAAWNAAMATHRADIRCSALRASESMELAERVQCMYALAYPEAQSSSEEVRDFLQQARRRDSSVRVLVRELVDLLDSQRYVE